MQDLSSETRLEKIQASHWMPGIIVRGNSEKVIVDAARIPGGLDGAPLQCVGGHEIAVFS